MYKEINKLDDYINRLNVRLINYESNKESLEDKVFRRFLDLAIVPTICNNDDYDVGYQFVDMYKLKEWDVNMDFIISLSLYNSRRINGIKFFPMMDYVKELGVQMYEEDPYGDIEYNYREEMFVLTNNPSYYGASTILYDDMLRSVRNFFRSDYYLIPSSLHEVIVYSAEYKEIDPEYIKILIKLVNSHVWSEKQILSNNLYLYSSVKDIIEIA
ncbi:MAG: hypothetical protein J5517_03650 [Eubacterium sp.]|nr:hypothetical protein [Eubacterium sp.]